MIRAIYILPILLCLIGHTLHSQTISLGCKNMADMIDQDRKNWTCDPTALSEAWMMDFAPIPDPGPCKEVDRLRFSITFNGSQNVPMGCFFDWYTNVFVNCNGFGICDCDDTGPNNLYGGAGVPTAITVTNPSNHIQIGDVISFDIVAVIGLGSPACQPFQDAISQGLATSNFNICLEVDYRDVSNGPSASASSMDANCGNSDGSVTIAWSGGAGPYNISGDLTQANAVSPFTFAGQSAGSYTVTVTDANGCTDTATAIVGDLAGPNASANGTTATCGMANGSVVVQWSGGTGPFNISGDLTQANAVSPFIFTGLSPNSYTVTVTDANGCMTTATAVVSNVDGPSVSVTGDDANCGNADGTVTVSWTGGTGPFNISGDLSQANAVSPFTFMGQAAGSYTVTVTDANGCTDTGTVTLGDTPGPNASASSTDASCGNNDGSVTITWSGGVGPFDISGDLNRLNALSPETFFSLSPGVYNITVTDANGCSSNASVSVNSSNSPIVSTSTTAENCGNGDGAVTITWSGGVAPFDISGDLTATNALSPENFTGLSAGSYTVTVTDGNGCTGTATAVVASNDGPNATGSSQSSNCGNADGEVSISWTGGAGPFDISGDLAQLGATSPTVFTGLSAGSYTVTLLDNNGCTDNVTVVVGETMGPIAIAVAVNSKCGNNDGTYTVSWVNGTGPFDISGDLVQSGATSPHVFNGLAANTYTVTVTDANGCSSSATAIVGNDDGPANAQAMASNANCDMSDGAVTVTWSGGTGPYNISGDLAQTGATSPQSFTGLAAGAYQLTITDANGCTTTATTTVGSDEGPSATATATEASCGSTDGSATISWTGGTGPFDISGALVQAGATSPQTFSNLGAGGYIVTVTDANGCTSTATATIGNSDGPTAAVVHTDENCGMGDGSITLGWSGGLAPYDISGDFTQSAVSPPQTFADLSAGTYTIMVTDANGCTSTATAIVEENDGPDAMASAVAASCGMSDGVFTLTWSGGVGPYNVSGDLSQMGAVSPLEFSGLASGTYAVTVTDANGCESIASAEVGNSDGPDAMASAMAASCGMSDGVVTLTWSGGVGPYNVSGDLSQMGAVSPLEFSGLASGTYSVTVTDANGCESIASAEVANSDGPEAMASAVAASCGMSDGVVTLTWSGGVGPYDVSGDLAQMGAVSPLEFSGLASGTYAVTVTDANGCESIASAEVANSDGPEAMASAVAASCGMSDGVVTLTWSGGVGPYDVSGDLAQMGAVSPLEFSGLASGTYAVTVTDANGCESIASAEVANSDGPEAMASAVAASCGMSDGVVTLTWSGGVGPYDVSGDLAQMGAVSPLEFSGLASGTYSMTVTDANGCESIASAEVGNSDGPDAMASAVAASCGLSDGVVTLTWSGGVGPYDVSGDLAQMGAVSPLEFSGLASGTYSMTVTDANGCESVASAEVGNSDGPEAMASVVATSCGMSDGVVTLTWSGGVGPYDVSGDLSQVGAASPLDFSGLASGTYSMTVTDANGCESVASAEVAGSDLDWSFSLEVSPSSVMPGEGSEIAVDLIGDIEWMDLVASWEPEVALDSSGAWVAYPQTSTLYMLTLTDADGCSLTEMVRVRVEEGQQISFPNVLDLSSANGANGVFYPKLDENRFPLVAEMKIYDRWGSLIFANANFPPNDESQGWAGVKDGRIIVPGVYIYSIIYVDNLGNAVRRVGDITVIN